MRRWHRQGRPSPMRCESSPRECRDAVATIELAARMKGGAFPLRGAGLSCCASSRCQSHIVSTLTGFHPSREQPRRRWRLRDQAGWAGGLTSAALPVAGDRGFAEVRHGYVTALCFARPLDVWALRSMGEGARSSSCAGQRGAAGNGLGDRGAPDGGQWHRQKGVSPLPGATALRTRTDFFSGVASDCARAASGVTTGLGVSSGWAGAVSSFNTRVNGASSGTSCP